MIANQNKNTTRALFRGSSSTFFVQGRDKEKKCPPKNSPDQARVRRGGDKEQPEAKQVRYGWVKSRSRVSRNLRARIGSQKAI